MELKYQFVVYIGIVVIIALLVFWVLWKRNKAYQTGKKVANSIYIKAEKYYKRKVIQYKIYSVLVVIAMFSSLLFAFLLMSRPYKTEVVDEEKYKRDIILCIDVSTSVDFLNMNLIKELKNTVTELKGERFGIVIFNSSAVLLTPLTDDYEAVLEQLDMLEKCLNHRSGSFFSINDKNMFYYDNYISSGTLVGVNERGSSLIADGLAASVFYFSDLDKERTRIMIFSTDNDPQGQSYVSLLDAAQMCKDKNITVFGVGTKEMYTDDKEEMKAAMEKTGGRFFLEEQSGSFDQIVTEIEKQSKNLVKGNHQMRENGCPKGFFVALLCSISCMMFFTWRLKR